LIPSEEKQTAEALGAFHKAEIEKWWPIIKSATSSPNPRRSHSTVAFRRKQFSVRGKTAPSEGVQHAFK